MQMHEIEIVRYLRLVPEKVLRPCVGTAVFAHERDIVLPQAISVIVIANVVITPCVSARAYMPAESMPRTLADTQMLACSPATRMPALSEVSRRRMSLFLWR